MKKWPISAVLVVIYLCGMLSAIAPIWLVIIVGFVAGFSMSHIAQLID